MPSFLLTQEQKQHLKQPLGELVSGSPQECNRILVQAVAKEKPVRLILVGDTVSRNAIQSGIKPDVIIIDNLEMRGKAINFKHEMEHVLRTVNPAGAIKSEAWQVVEEAMRTGNSIIEVNGEEDLLTLVAILVAPSRSFVVYGQPGEGIVLVRVTESKKKEIQVFIERMEKRG